MEAKRNIPIPVNRALIKLGKDISDARKRRRIPGKLLAERADISLRTLSKIEKGDGSVSLTYYASVIFVLGMIDRLESMLDIKNDKLGLMLEEENLPQRIRIPKSKDAE